MNIIRTIFIFFVLISLQIPVLAQAPQKMSYQAVVRDADNNLLKDKEIAMEIRIVQGDLNGIEVYVEKHIAFTNQFGLVSVQIGNGIEKIGVFSNIQWENGPYFILTNTDPEGGSDYSIKGHSELLSVPYALHANSNGETLWKENLNGIYYLGGNIGLGISETTTPGIHVKIKNASIRLEDVGELAGDVYQMINNTKGNDVLNFAIYNKTDERAELSFAGDGNVSLLNGYFGVGVEHVEAPGIHVRTKNATLRLEDVGYFAGDVYQLTNNTQGNDVLNFAIYNKTDERAELSFDGDGNISMLFGNVGIGNKSAKSKLQVSDGDVYIDKIEAGVIMRSPDGQCWRMTVNNDGQPVFKSINCPN